MPIKISSNTCLWLVVFISSRIPVNILLSRAFSARSFCVPRAPRLLGTMAVFSSGATGAGASDVGRSVSAPVAAVPGTTAQACLIGNPLLESWETQPFALPPFGRIETPHFKPALEQGMVEHLADLQAIVDNPEDPSFETVICAYDRAGATLGKVRAVFGNLCSSLNTQDLQLVQKEMSPILSRHRSKTYTLPGLFTKIQAVYDQRLSSTSGLTLEQLRLIERIHLDFTRAGAHFDEPAQQENADIQAQLATLSTQFMQNVLKDEETYEIILKKEDLIRSVEILKEALKVCNKV